MTFLARAMSSPNGTPSSTRLFLAGVVITLLAFAWAILLKFIFTGEVAEIPINTAGFLGGLLAIVATLKGFQDRKDNDQKTG